LTGAAGLLAASALLGIWGDDLTLALVGLIRDSWSGDLMVGAGSDAAEFVARIRVAVWSIAGPLLGILGGTLAVAIGAHQAQVGGLFAPALLAPDFSRLWGLHLDEEGMGSGLMERAGRGAWSVVKAVVVVAVASWLIRSSLGDLQRLGRLEPMALAKGAGAILRSTAFAMALATLALGLVDFALQHQRFEAMLRMASGLILILAGGPPPRRILIRSSANGATGKRLKKSAEAAKVPLLEAPALALALARLRTPVVPPELMASLSSEWPVEA
jgi:flagellar biosynthetic protein FlhB